MDGLTQAEFARRDGCTPPTVSRGVREGRLRLLPEGGLDPLQVGTQWRERTPRKGGGGRKKQKAPSTGVQHRGDDYALALFKKEQALTSLRELELAQKSGAAVALDVVQREFFSVARHARDSWLNWPAAASPLIATELGLEPDRVMRLLVRHVQTHIASLGEPQASFSHGTGPDSTPR
jgi:hypothetical protein